MKNLSLGLLVALAAAACGSIEQITGREPIVDMQGVNVTAYQADLWECERYASQVRVGRQVAVGAAGGAVLGGAVGASVGNSDTAREVAGAGAAVGAVSAAEHALHERGMVIRNCLSGRGYRVLN